MNNKVHVKTGDEVIVINGKYRGQKGKVLEVAPSEGKIIVEGINIITKHVKPRKMGEAGGLIKAASTRYTCAVSRRQWTSFAREIPTGTYILLQQRRLRKE